MEHFEAGARHDDPSVARIRIESPTAAALDDVLASVIQNGAVFVDREIDARLTAADMDGVAPDEFYSTTIYPTDVRINGRWTRATGQRMDAVLVVDGGDAAADGSAEGGPAVRCALFRDIRFGQRVVCGVDGIRIHAAPAKKAGDEFAFMSSGVSSERRVELSVDQIAAEMQALKAAGGRVVVVAGPVVVHTGGGPHLARLIRAGHVQALLGGNAIAVHDIEQNLYGTRLGVDMAKGVGVHEGHRHHLKAINLVRRHGGVRQAVEAGLVTGGVMFECVKAGVPFALAGSIRDDGPIPDTEMDLVRAQKAYGELVRGASMVLMLSSMLHAIGTGNMIPAGVKLVCVDISPAVVTKLADRGSVESRGIVTDVGLFLNLLAAKLGV